MISKYIAHMKKNPTSLIRNIVISLVISFTVFIAIKSPILLIPFGVVVAIMYTAFVNVSEAFKQ